jgi:hypothetical protein
LAALPVATHVAVPLAHDIVPFWQVLGGLPGVHVPPAVQAVHVPLSHTPPVHAVPLATLPVDTQAATPVAHDTVPF